MMALGHILDNHMMKAISFVELQCALLPVCSLIDSKNRLKQQVRVQMHRAPPTWTQYQALLGMPSHEGVFGNEEADKLAASIKNNLETSLGLPHESEC